MGYSMVSNMAGLKMIGGWLDLYHKSSIVNIVR